MAFPKKPKYIVGQGAIVRSLRKPRKKCKCQPGESCPKCAAAKQPVLPA